METAGLTLAELDAQTADCLPPREVMCSCYHSGGRSESNSATVGSYNGNQSSSGLIAVNVGIANGSFNGNGVSVTQAV